VSHTSTISTEFSYQLHHLEVNGSRLHYVDEGVGDSIVFLHGNPTSSYLWRNIIPYMIPLGRCIVLDLIGMGKSDKPDIEYRFVEHLQYVEIFMTSWGYRMSH
jgi:haloalkane dehalogenase